MALPVHYIVFYNVISENAGIDEKELVARLVDTKFFTKNQAIWWCVRKNVQLELCKHYVYEKPSLIRKISSRVCEMYSIFSLFIPPYQESFGITREIYNALHTLKKYGHLVRIYDIYENKILIILPDIYDHIIHGHHTGNFPTKSSRYRYWSDYKFEVLGPVSNKMIDGFIVRTFTFPPEILKFPIQNLFEGNLLALLSDFLAAYMANLKKTARIKLTSKNYIDIYRRTTREKIEQWEKYLVKIK